MFTIEKTFNFIFLYWALWQIMFFCPIRDSIGILEIDFEGIFEEPFFWVFHEFLWVFHKVLWNFHKVLRIFYWFYQKEKSKIEIWLLFPLLIKEMGHFKNPLWCTVDKTQGAKIQIWDVPHKLTSLRNSGNFILSISMHRGQRYDSAKFCSCCLNTLYIPF